MMSTDTRMMNNPIAVANRPMKSDILVFICEGELLFVIGVEIDWGSSRTAPMSLFSFFIRVRARPADINYFLEDVEPEGSTLGCCSCAENDAQDFETPCCGIDGGIADFLALVRSGFVFEPPDYISTNGDNLAGLIWFQCHRLVGPSNWDVQVCELRVKILHSAVKLITFDRHGWEF